MSFLPVEFTDCPWTTDGVRRVSFDQLDLQHAAVAIGRNWRQRARTTEDHHHVLARIHDILSSVDISGHQGARVSMHYRSLGSTERGTKSFSIGNAFCALIAAKELRVPWLVDLENLSRCHRVGWRPGKRRADFIGRTPAGRWFVFEAKGRSRPPADEHVEAWKEQARMVRHVNGQRPEACIVSAAYAQPDRSLHAIWRDPPPDGGEDIQLEEQDFLTTYYRPILGMIESIGRFEDYQGHRLAILPDAHFSVGIHARVRKALSDGTPADLWRFAEAKFESRDIESSGDETLRIFPDGLIVMRHVSRVNTHVVADE